VPAVCRAAQITTASAIRRVANSRASSAVQHVLGPPGRSLRIAARLGMKVDPARMSRPPSGASHRRRQTSRKSRACTASAFRAERSPLYAAVVETRVRNERAADLLVDRGYRSNHVFVHRPARGRSFAWTGSRCESDFC
jgi:hypothetical protein